MSVCSEAARQSLSGIIALWHESSETLNASKLAVLLLAAGLLSSAAALRSFEYDEAYTVFVISGTPRPAWPDTPFVAGQMRPAFTGHAGVMAVARSLRDTDVHPPLYFWAVAAWRGLVGNGLLALRLLSALCALAALCVIGGIARSASVSPCWAMLLTACCYGFAYTSAVARGFSLAQALALGGVLLALRAAERGRTALALGAGLLLGAASFTNYLSVFVGGASAALVAGCANARCSDLDRRVIRVRRFPAPRSLVFPRPARHPRWPVPAVPVAAQPGDGWPPAPRRTYSADCRSIWTRRPPRS